MDQGQQLLLGDIRRQAMQSAAQAGFGTGLLLVAHIHLTGGVVTRKDGGKMRSNPGPLVQRLNLPLSFKAALFGDLLTID